MSKRALITGITGQDGSLLRRELESHGRSVFGMSRSAARESTVFSVDYQDRSALHRILDHVGPQEIYHLACPSQLKDSEVFERAVLELSTTTSLILLRWIAEQSPETRFFFASSSEIFGNPDCSPQDEASVARPEHPYAVAKLAGQQLVASFRTKKGLFASTGILFNHESDLRRTEFVSRRITHAVANIAAGREDKLTLGNLDACRDWSHAAEFVSGFRLCLEASDPGDFVFASGVGHTVRQFCHVAFAAAGLEAYKHVVSDVELFHPDFANPRIGCAEKAASLLGWRIERPFEEWVTEMVRIEMRNLSAPPQ